MNDLINALLLTLKISPFLGMAGFAVLAMTKVMEIIG